MPNDVIAMIHSIADKEKRPEQLRFDVYHAAEDDDFACPPSDVDFVPNPIDPFELILSSEVETDIISEDKMKALSPNNLSDNEYNANNFPYDREGTTEDEAV